MLLHSIADNTSDKGNSMKECPKLYSLFIIYSQLILQQIVYMKHPGLCLLTGFNLQHRNIYMYMYYKDK